MVLGGHYDTVPDVPGANDNGSGIATLLVIAREVSEISYPFTLRIIAFGSEELGLEGSRFYVDSLSPEEQKGTVAMLNFDALGSGEVLGVLGTFDLTTPVLQAAEENDIDAERRFNLGRRLRKRPFVVPAGGNPRGVLPGGRLLPNSHAGGQAGVCTTRADGQRRRPGNCPPRYPGRTVTVVWHYRRMGP